MSDTTVAQEAPLPNETAARTETGEIKDLTPQTTPPTKKADLPEPEPTLLNEKDEGAKPPGPPEKYEFKLPEGFNMDEKTSTEVNTMFKEMGLSQENAQKLVDFYAGRMTEATEAPMTLWSETQKQWIDQVKADPVIGKRLPEVKATVSKAIDGLGDPALAKEFRQAMDVTGAGNNPAFIKTFYRLAQMVTEGGHVSGRGPSPAGQEAPDAKPKTAASALYPNLS